MSIRLDLATGALASKMGGGDYIISISAIVENKCYHKTVEMHYYDGTGPWKTRALSWTCGINNHEELWKCELRGTNTHGAYVVFALHVVYHDPYESAWDNNHRNDYRVGMGGVGGSRPPWAALGSAVKLGWSSYDNNTLKGSVAVRNIAFQKTVSIHYTNDNWITKNIIGCCYNGSSPVDNGEAWDFSVYVPSSGVRFAASYGVGGQEYWDNNYGRNYAW